ncbi:MAG: sigma-54-dependent Fis family transcriptional regulator [Planctomycetes bacterium]|nr:sigma-54-dependent Fis family transcriptional regulator [Planctomycetota bacterium]
MSVQDQPTITSAYRSVGVTFESLVCNSEPFREAIRLAASAAGKDVSILLLGETGTGKNLIAQAIHNASRRHTKPFVSVNCSAIPDSLLESELFGSEKGAFTSSDKLRRGKFELADGGTLFLDEIGDMSAIAQAKVLRAFEYRQFERVGGEQTLHTDVRIIAATNRPLDSLLATGKFREDLFYRMNEFTIEVPPLRSRKPEIEPLAQRFIKECNERFGTHIKSIEPDAMKKLQAHSWPGNVRELRAVIKRASVAAPGEQIRSDDLRLSVGPTPTDEVKPDGDLSMSSVEAKHIEKVLNKTGWNKKETSGLLGISRPTLDRKITEYNLKKPD